MEKTTLKLITLVAIFFANSPLFAQEYINDMFRKWNNLGTAGSTNSWANGTQTISCMDDIDRTFSLQTCIVDNAYAASGACSNGAVYMKNGNTTLNDTKGGYLVFPILPDVGRVSIMREGKAAGNYIRLEVKNANGQWEIKENDGITETKGCGRWDFSFTSSEPVEMRLFSVGNSAIHLHWIYVEGLEGGSVEPYIPPTVVPTLPDESKVILMENKADSIAFETLVGISGYGWDPANKGILINWHRQYPDRVNNTSGGDYDDRNGQTRHDSQNDVRALQHYYWWKYLHNGNPYFDMAIARLLPTVKSKYAKTSSTKGWMYYVLLRLWEFTDNPADKDFWRSSVLSWGNNVMKEIDPTMGIYYSTNMGNCDCGLKTIYLDKAYRVDHQVQAGAALVDAGTRFNKPEWVAAGYKQVLTTYEQAFSERYGFFGRIFLLGNSGYTKNADGTKNPAIDYSNLTNKLWDSQVKIGEVSEEIDALMRAAEITTNPVIRDKFQEIATKMLNSLRNLGVHDKTYAGFFQNMTVATTDYNGAEGKVSGNQKEMRQASLLGTYNIANRYMDNQWPDMEKEMYYLLINENTLPLVNKNTNPTTFRGMYLPNIEKDKTGTINGYRKSLAGYSYQLDYNWSVMGDWVSNESNSLILLGIFEHLMAVQQGYNDSFIHGSPSGFTNTKTNDIRLWMENNTLNVSGTCNKLELFNIFGQSVALLPVTDGKFDVSSYPAGIYILQAVISSGKTVQAKFLKK